MKWIFMSLNINKMLNALAKLAKSFSETISSIILWVSILSLKLYNQSYYIYRLYAFEKKI